MPRSAAFWYNDTSTSSHVRSDAIATHLHLPEIGHGLGIAPHDSLLQHLSRRHFVDREKLAILVDGADGRERHCQFFLHRPVVKRWRPTETECRTNPDAQEFPNRSWGRPNTIPCTYLRDRGL
jgi:hypothetical protein